MSVQSRRLAGDAAAWAGVAEGRPMKWAEVAVSALRDNVAALRAHVAPATAVMAMIKANGYGHGALLTAVAAIEGGATWLGVATPEEALQIAAADLGAAVLHVGWTHPSQLEALVRAGVRITVYEAAAVAAVAAAARQVGRAARVHVKIDSGMGRLGARPEAVGAVAAALRDAGDDAELEAAFTHFADADGADLEFTEEQHRVFLDAVPPLQDVNPALSLHCANSAATLRLPHMHHDIVRPGIAIYGYAPPECGGVVELRAAMSLVACVTQVKTIRAGDTVGYGRTWTARHDTRVATIAAGYADGVHRAQTNRGAALVHGERVPVIGRVSMDQITLDVSDVESVATGDEVALFGRQGDAFLGADEVAAVEGTISYEILCNVSARVPRFTV
jgi:alanine racemase